LVEQYAVFIEQEGDSVALRENDERISVGEVRGDTLFCTDWRGYGVGRVFIDDRRHMHSETPLNESLKVILFERQGCVAAILDDSRDGALVPGASGSADPASAPN